MDSNRPPRKVKFHPKPPKQQKEILTGQSSTKADSSSSSKAPQQEEIHTGLTNADSISSSEEEKKSSSSEEEDNFYFWDDNINYPITLPWKNPHGGDIDEEALCDESTINCAAELGLLEKNDEPQMIMFQLPHCLAELQVDKDDTAASGSRIPANAKGKGKVLPDDDQKETRGYRGKLLVYKSGNVKMKIEDDIWNVSPVSIADLLKMSL